MSIADCVNLICAILSLIATILIGVWQIKQSNRISKLEAKQHQEAVDIEARRFLSKYNDCIGLLPLCAIAFAYNSNRAYSREMYAEFRLLPKDVRLKIFEKCDWAMCDVETSNFFEDCLTYLRAAIEKFMPKDDFNSLFYDNGKYLEETIVYFAKEAIPNERFDYQREISKTIKIPFREETQNEYTSNVIDKICAVFDFSTCEETYACLIACLIAQYISIYSGQKLTNDNEDNIDYGIPGGWAGERVETMEDLFLETLFDIWTNLHYLDLPDKHNK